MPPSTSSLGNKQDLCFCSLGPWPSVYSETLAVGYAFLLTSLEEPPQCSSPDGWSGSLAPSASRGEPHVDSGGASAKPPPPSHTVLQGGYPGTSVLLLSAVLEITCDVR